MTEAVYTRTRPLLTIDHVSMAFDGRPVLRDIHEQILDLDRHDGSCTGQVVCLLGPSGCGKTTLARIISGLARPTEGQVRVGVGQQPVRRGVVGMVPQAYPLFRYATVRQNCLIAAKQGGHDRGVASELVHTYAQDFGLTPYLDLYPSQVSGGTRQRVAIVRQLLCSDHFIVMDEPFSGLDPLLKRRASAFISHVANQDTTNTILVSSHDLTEGLSIADTVWLMGREPDPDGGFRPGTRIVEKYDLAALGLCWRPNLTSDPDFLALVAQVRDRFTTLGF